MTAAIQTYADEAAGARRGRAPSRRLRLALFAGSYHTVRDGVTLTLNRLVAFLRRQGVRTLVFAPDGPAVFPHEGRVAPVPSLPLPLRPEYRLALGLPARERRRLSAFDPDVIHLATPDLLGHEALRLGQSLGRPIVGSYHTRYETYLEHYGLGFLAEEAGRRIRRFYEGCREVYVPSDSMAEALRASGAACDIRLWGRGVDAERFHPARRSEAWRAGQGFAPGELVISFVGRLVREKRLATYAEALNRLNAQGIACRALVVGDGPDRAWLERQLPQAVFAGFLDGESLAVAYASSDLFFFPSDTETFGAVTLEAMASGLPTLCADATGSRSLVDPGVTGFLERPDDAAAFAARVRLLASDAELRRRMGEAARARSLSFTWDEAMNAILNRYQALAAAA
jgi:glycosyltransferase involved in cell wall biosynthesis